MKALLGILSSLPFALSAHSQIEILAADYPSQIGASRRAYVDDSDPAVGSLVGTTGGPQVWDFSYPVASDETIYRIEVVPPSDASCPDKAGDAQYSERTTRESTGVATWESFSLVPGLGRLYFGLCNRVSDPNSPGVLFKTPTLQFPECAYGSSWTRETSWLDQVDAGFGPMAVAVNFTSSATVDAYGTLILPELGEVPAIRVNETNRYDSFLTDLGFSLGSQHFHNYYWLVPGIGKAVEIYSKPSSTGAPATYTTGATLLRIFDGKPTIDPTPDFFPVTGLRLERKGPQLFLSWNPAGPGYSYVIATSVPPPALPNLIAPNSIHAGVFPEQTWLPYRTNQDNFLFIDLPTASISGFIRVGATR